ncbi:MAG: PPC domain-containing protein [Planctomycetaceae bacterium]|nr:PPC domain-containing protein [Planctomycetales bacterium]MCB9927300.1 PPC domain-containing protein [Planctomycetaceae bacterium]
MSRCPYKAELLAGQAIVAIVMAGSLMNVPVVAQQQPPAIGYMYPPGGQTGTTIDVVLGGYDWTPDIKLFVHDPQISLELTGSPGPVIVPEPPYWFEKKARRSPFLLPRETPAKLTIPIDAKPGVYRWQAANANGATATGRFMVSRLLELQEQPERSTPQNIDSLPAVVSGQILKIEEVDDYRFRATRDGPITLSLAAAALNSPLTAIVEVRNEDGQVIAEAADTNGDDLQLTFTAKEKQLYVVSVYDVDFRGNRSFVYRVSFIPGPAVVATIPAAGRRGETRDVEFVGCGVATGGESLESVTRSVTFPKDSSDTTAIELETAFGWSGPVSLLLSDISEVIEPVRHEGEASLLAVPSAVTGVLDERYGSDRYRVECKKGDVLIFDLQANAIGSELDVSLSVLDAQGEQLRLVDDSPGTTDATLEFVVPADGTYDLVVSDSSGRSGTRASTYRLAARHATPDFTLSVPEFVNVPIGEKSQLQIKATRIGGFKDPIDLRIDGVPSGISLPEKTLIPAGKNEIKIELAASAEAGTVAAVLSLEGRALIGNSEVMKQIDPVLLAVTMKPPFKIDAEGKDDVTKWPRGTTFPGPVLIQRDEGFTGNIVLEMAAKQGRHRQGIHGPELAVPPEVERVLYPVFLPEWLETTRTSRMVVNGVAQVADPAGRVRYLSSKLETRIGFLPTGALLKISCDVPELEVVTGRPFQIPVTVDRARSLESPAIIEIVDDRQSSGVVFAEPIQLDADRTQTRMNVVSLVDRSFVGERTLTIRATVMQEGRYPVVSEGKVLVAFGKEEAR